MRDREYLKLAELTTQNKATEKSVKRFEENRKRKWGLLGVDTGIHDLNLAIGGWIPGKLTTIAGRSGTGKTSISVPFFDKGGTVVNGRRAEFIFFTWEMAPDYLVDRHISHVTGIDNRMFTQGAKLLSPQELAEIKKAYGHADTLPVIYQEMALDITKVQLLYSQFADKCKEKSKVEGVEVLPVAVIDYVNMAMFEGSGLRTYGIQEFMNGLKRMVNKERGAACVFAQINRSADDKGVPTRADLSDSQHIENASDNLIILHRPEHHGETEIQNPMSGEDVEAKNTMLMRLVKCRDGAVGDILMHCEIGLHRYWSWMHEQTTNYPELYNDSEFWMQHFGINKIDTTHKHVNIPQLFDEHVT